LRTEQVGRFVIAKIRYPDCTSYEAEKILVFESTTVRQVRAWRRIDPHFCDGEHNSPIARFKAAAPGWSRARRFCRLEESLKKKQRRARKNHLS